MLDKIAKDRVWKSNIVELGEEDGNAATTTAEKVCALENNIYYYSEVSRSSCLMLNKLITKISTELKTFAFLEDRDPAAIKLHINSFGGSVFAGLSSVDYIINAPVPTISIINGCAASAATLMSVVASKRKMHQHSFMLIHQLSSHMWGKYTELQDDMKNNELLMETIKSIYKNYTEVPPKELDKILEHDLWWDAKTCLKYGLVDEIIYPV